MFLERVWVEILQGLIMIALLKLVPPKSMQVLPRKFYNSICFRNSRHCEWDVKKQNAEFSIFVLSFVLKALQNVERCSYIAHLRQNALSGSCQKKKIDSYNMIRHLKNMRLGTMPPSKSATPRYDLHSILYLSSLESECEHTPYFSQTMYCY